MEFDWVIFTIPPAQVVELMPFNLPWMRKLGKLQMLPCISLMGLLQQTHGIPWDGAFIKNSLLGWIGFNHTKPERTSPPALVVQTTYEWALENKKRSDNEIKLLITEQLNRIMPKNKLIFDQLELKRWAYAVIEEPLGEDFLIDKEHGIAIAGDWCVGSKIESAFESAIKLTKKFSSEVF